MMREGFETYCEFMPAGWEPTMPPADGFRERIATASTFTLVAEEDDLAGHVSFVPSDVSGHAAPEPGLAHLWQLFVREPYWGTGLATELMQRALAEARAQGFAEMRLFTPAGQARARRFYEREGFALIRVFDEPRLSMDMAEYRRALSG